ncbi:hypothetical protein [Streptococcus mutans]|uniref:hypothetical protein n=1 Tax=Streptococcus mutans TaxID=1309 RepID=UPI0002B535E7|nr:hypothetical protein [Streptococcus mutans]EMC04559.1 hypothetical protein SMU70_08753 [Streptococcus mutans NLML5]EMC41530.1 hypothetical protein SMU98_09717 [Streptococcus mutans SM1]MCB4937676.1 hypothetical protein [Streptococcus mutans]MCB4964153.1 hypothetical protein [Streptococcus mutans]MCB5042042.1 hypothetical protein [Streptococcus mutans]
MTRQNYFELIQNMEFDANKEFEIISRLISEKKLPFLSAFSSLSIQEVFNINFLLYLKYRKIQFISYSEVKEYFENSMNGTERLFSYIEFIIDLNSFLEKNQEKLIKSVPYNFSNISYSFREIEDRINYSLDKTNYELVELDNGNQIIVEKNAYASKVSQIVSETNIQEAMKVLEYNHFANKGNIQRKQEILISLANYLEPLRDELNSAEELKEVLKVNNKKIIATEKLFEMYNQFGLRHNNNKQYHTDMTKEELEQWYDDIYTSTLFVVLSLDEARVLSKLNQFKMRP